MTRFSHFAEFELVINKIGLFAKFEQVIIKFSHFAEFEIFIIKISHFADFEQTDFFFTLYNNGKISQIN